MKSKKVLEKSEVLRQTNLSIHSLRHYIKFFKGIVPGCLYIQVLKGKRGSRAYYSQKTVDMINRIRKLKEEQGKKLAQIRIELQTEEVVNKAFRERGLKRDGTVPFIVHASNPDFKSKIFIGEGEMEEGLTECFGKPKIIITKNGGRIMKWRG